MKKVTTILTPIFLSCIIFYAPPAQANERTIYGEHTSTVTNLVEGVKQFILDVNDLQIELDILQLITTISDECFPAEEPSERNELCPPPWQKEGPFNLVKVFYSIEGTSATKQSIVIKIIKNDDGRYTIRNVLAWVVQS